MAEDIADALAVVQHYRTIHAEQTLQLTKWLGLGGAGGAVALLSFCANLPQPDYALRQLMPAISAFISCLLCVGPIFYTRSKEASATEVHYASASNRSQLRSRIDATPEAIAAPRSLADDLNRSRNTDIGRHDAEHERAEAAWIKREQWRFLRRTFTLLACFSFVVGTCLPLVLVATGTALAARPDAGTTVTPPPPVAACSRH